MHVQVNGETMELPEDGGMSALLKHMGASPERVALLLNDCPVRRSEWSTVRLKAGDRVEVLSFAGGG